MRYVPVIVVLFFALSAWAQKPLTAAEKAAYDDFTQACLSAFSKSGGEQNPTGKGICQCTSDESRHQRVSIAELKKETAEIRRDPKYNIQNKKLLDAFHYCIVLAMHDAEHAH